MSDEIAKAPSGEDLTEHLRQDTNPARWSYVSRETETTYYGGSAAQRKNANQRLKSERVKTTVEIDAADVIAFFAGIIAVLFAIAMVVGWVPINTLTIGVVTFAAITPIMAQAVKRSKKG